MNPKPRRRSLDGFWPKIVLKKWLNISSRDSDFSADEENDTDTESEIDNQDGCGCGPDMHDGLSRKIDRLVSNVSTAADSSLKGHRRRKSETLRVQYIDSKEIRVCVGTWNVGGQLPTDETGIEKWLDIEEPADVYVLGLQEIVPLNAGNVLGAEDNRPIPRWESLIRENLNRIQQAKPTIKCHSDPPSPSRFKPSDDSLQIESEMLFDSDSGNEEEIHSLDDQFSGFESENNASSENSDPSEDGQEINNSEKIPLFPSRKLSRSNHFILTDDNLCMEERNALQRPTLARLLSNSERIGLSWPERPLDLENQINLRNSRSFKSIQSFKHCRSILGENRDSLPSLVPDLQKLESMGRRKSPAFVKIISKQMVGIYLSVWVRRGLRKHIQNVKVSTVGVGVMGYIGNKGSIAVSMSIYQTLFCFICCHLSAGEKEGDELRRNADVQEIKRRTLFSTLTNASFQKTISDHEKIIWLGDLNYRINLSYERTIELISKRDWFRLREKDQLKREFRKGGVFDGWLEGDLNFPPTYKYESNSTKYIGSDPKVGRRTPAWCDRILSYGKGMKLLSYKRSELTLSDHRPVTAMFSSEVEVFSHRKLKKALTLTHAEIQNCDMALDMDGCIDYVHS